MEGENLYLSAKALLPVSHCHVPSPTLSFSFSIPFPFPFCLTTSFKLQHPLYRKVVFSKTSNSRMTNLTLTKCSHLECRTSKQLVVSFSKVIISGSSQSVRLSFRLYRLSMHTNVAIARVRFHCFFLVCSNCVLLKRTLFLPVALFIPFQKASLSLKNKIADVRIVRTLDQQYSCHLFGNQDPRTRLNFRTEQSMLTAVEMEYSNFSE